MRVHNVHERTFNATAARVGALIDGLASETDRLWPSARWPSMRFDRPLQLGALGGHGPIRYHVEAYEPGSRVRFRLQGPRGFDGWHGFEVVPGPDGATLRHTIEMRARGPAIVTWPVVFGPLHDALLEDCLDAAARALGTEQPPRDFSRWVRLLRGGYRRLARRR